MADKVEQDKRLGKIGGEDTKVCAKSGREVSAGMARYSLGGDWYFRVYPKYIASIDEQFIAEMRALVPVEKASAKKESEGSKS